MAKEKNDLGTKTIFAVINLKDSEEQQAGTIRYAANLAVNLGLELVIHPSKGFGEFVKASEVARQIKRTIPDAEMRVSKERIGTLNFFSSLQTIAVKENAAYMVIQTEKETARMLGNTIWGNVEKTIIPILIVPHGVEFVPYKRVTIALDADRNLQKMNVVEVLAKTFASTINIFQENVEDESKKTLILNSLKHVKTFLVKQKIPFIVIPARKRINFPKHLCKYSAKHADLLIVEVGQGKIDAVVKQNIETLLTIDQRAQPVLLVKTKQVGKFQNFR
ncbi:MAG: hypothetical protein NTY80_02175 [candidate division SR1 bacterium]|nr:hypothetical protein [candidate division SR1 bacterium]